MSEPSVSTVPTNKATFAAMMRAKMPSAEQLLASEAICHYTAFTETYNNVKQSRDAGVFTLLWMQWEALHKTLLTMEALPEHDTKDADVLQLALARRRVAKMGT